MRLGLSNYGSLCTKSFDIVTFIRSIAEDGGADFTRCFIDLMIGEVFDPDNAVYLYEWDKAKKEWKLGRISQAFVDRLGLGGREARHHNLQIVLDGMTDPSYSKQSIMQQIGYTNSKDLIQRGNFPGANWEGVKQYHADLATVLKEVNMPRVFAYWEILNESPGWGSIYEEVRDCCAEMKGAYRALQYNPPPLQDPHQDGYNPDAGCFTDWAWPKQLIAGKGGIKVKRIAYHSMFSADQIAKELLMLKKAAIPAEMVTFSTDGATPGFGFKYPGQTGGHYKMRPKWKLHKQDVILAHGAMVKTALKGGAACEIQEMSAWFGDEISTVMDPDVVDFRKAMKLAIPA